MSLSAEAAAIIAAVNGNTDQKVALVTGRLDRHEGLIVDLGPEWSPWSAKNLGVGSEYFKRCCGIDGGWGFDDTPKSTRCAR